MLDLNVARIPFSVKLAEGLFKGEAIGIGDSIKADGIFEVRLADGNTFYVKAERDYELRRFNWKVLAANQVQKLIPILGRVIERYYARKLA